MKYFLSHENERYGRSLQQCLQFAAAAATARQNLWIFFCCYSDEDMVGQRVEMAESCHPSTMTTTALFKWLTIVFAEDHED